MRGGGIGALWGKAKDSGVEHDDVKELAGSLTPGQAALIVMVSQSSAEVARRALGSYEGELVRTTYSEGDFLETCEDETKA